MIADAEDPTLFLSPDGEVIHMIAHGELTRGDLFDVGVHAVSADGVAWSTPQIAYLLRAMYMQSKSLSLPLSLDVFMTGQILPGGVGTRCLRTGLAKLRARTRISGGGRHRRSCSQKTGSGSR